MSGWKKLAAASAAGGGVDVDEVFSTYLYKGNGSAQTITNGIDLDGEGGMVWIKTRSASGNNRITDTERGSSKYLKTNDTAAELTDTTSVTSFNSDGFSVGTSSDTNSNGVNTASWTFRKTPKFFDIVTYTGTGPSTVRNLSHDLGCAVGCLIVKRLDSAESWYVWHKGFGDNGYMTLNSTNAKSSYTGLWNNTAPTSTQFTVTDDLNATGATFVVYLWAHNNNDGEFGPDGDADIIKCGSYTGTGSGGYDDSGPEIDLDFEPQWLLIKNITRSANWMLFDTMRGISARSTTDSPNSGTDYVIHPNRVYAENDIFSLKVTPNGFKQENQETNANRNGDNYIYMAIRRGPLAVPEDATDVFEPDLSPNSNDPRFISGFPVDMAMQRKRTSSGIDGFQLTSRLTQNRYNHTGMTNAEQSTSTMDMDYMNGFDDDGDTATDFIAHMWKRAPGFFDVVTYTGNGTAGRTISHNLGVAPEMMWVKSRSHARQWVTYDATNGATGRMNLDDDGPWGSSSSYWNNTAPTDSVFTVGNQYDVNSSLGYTYIAYLFATLAGKSKVGSYTGNGSSQTINCGFSAGARYILIKRTDSNGNWYVWDSARGIAAGNDPYLTLDTTAAEASNDSIDPANSGFIVNQVSATNINVSSATYIFYAIA